MTATRSRARSRPTFAKDAAKYAAECAERGVDWDEQVWPRIVGGYELAGFGQPTFDEEAACFEAWNSAYVRPEAGERPTAGP